MPPRRAKEEPQQDGFNFVLSQASHASSDDDTTLQIALAEKLNASKEKRKKENQQKFLAASRKHLLKELTTPIEDIQVTLQSVEELLQAFVTNYATEEDNIRKIWCEIIEEERKLQSFMENCYSNNETASEIGVKTLDLKGRLFTTYQNYQKVIDFVKPTRGSS